MKNLFFVLAFLFVGSVGFAATSEVKNDKSEKLEDLIELKVEKINDKLLVHTCYYRVTNSKGEVIGYLIVHDVPDNVDCGSTAAIAIALEIWDSH